MPEQGGGKGFGRLPFNYRGQRLASRGERPCCTIQQRCPASVSILDTRSGPRGRAPPGLLHMYYMRLCSEKLLADIRGLCSPFSPSSSPPRDNVPPLSSENSTRVTLHLARVHRLAALVSRADATRYRRSPSVFFFSFFRPLFVLFHAPPHLRLLSTIAPVFAGGRKEKKKRSSILPRDRATSVDAATANSSRDGFFPPSQR